MKVAYKKDVKTILNVYGIYWHDDKTYFCVSPANYNGLLACSYKDMLIVDNSIGPDFIFLETSNHIHKIFHKELSDEKFLNDLLELNESAYKKFVSLLGGEP